MVSLSVVMPKTCFNMESISSSQLSELAFPTYKKSIFFTRQVTRDVELFVGTNQFDMPLSAPILDIQQLFDALWTNPIRSN